MTIQEVIQKAVEGGWMRDSEMKPEEWQWKWEIMVCDPLFWQALGKSMGWQKDEVRLKKLRGELEYEESYYNTAVEYPTETPQFYDALQRQTDRIRNIRDSIYAIENGLDWKTHWHRLIDHLAEGKSIEDFFAPL